MTIACTVRGMARSSGGADEEYTMALLMTAGGTTAPDAFTTSVPFCTHPSTLQYSVYDAVGSSM